MPCTNVNREVMMQYHDWGITIILTLDDTLPFHNNFCSYCNLGNAIFVIFVAVECTGVNLVKILAKTKSKQLWCFAHHFPLIANYSPSWVQSMP